MDRLSEGMSRRELRQDGMYTPEELIRSVLYIGHAEDGGRLWNASGFLVRLDRRNANDAAVEWPTYLVTAKHVVVKLRYEHRRVFCALQAMGAPHLECELPDNAWHLHDEQDIAIMPFDFAWLTKPAAVADWPWGRIVHSVSVWQFGCAPVGRPQFQFSNPVHMVGLWRASREVSWPPIVRTGFFAATSPEQFQLETGRSYAYMVDGTVTHGMSGGLAFLTAGVGIAENSVLGRIHGYWSLPEDELGGADGAVAVLDGQHGDAAHAARHEALLQIRREMHRMNSQIALLIREIEISNFFDAVLGQPPNTIYQPRD